MSYFDIWQTTLFIDILSSQIRALVLMGYYLKFVGFLGLFLLSLLFIGWRLRDYGLNRPSSSLQTALIQQLMDDPPPLIWKARGSLGTYVFLKAAYERNQWVVVNQGRKEKLELVLQKDRSKALLIDIRLNSTLALHSLRRILNKNRVWKKVLICSRADGLLDDLRKLEPGWSFCNGEVFITRILSLASLGLEPLLSINSDVFFIHLENLSLTPRLVPIMKEAKRQGKMVFVGPVIQVPQNYPVDAWVVEN